MIGSARGAGMNRSARGCWNEQVCKGVLERTGLPGGVGMNRSTRGCWNEQVCQGVLE